MFLCCTSLWIVLWCQWGSFTAAIHCEVIINDLLSGLIMSILRENDLQTYLDPAGIHQALTEHCNRQLCHTLSSLLLMLMFFSLKWLPVIVFFLSCLPDVISPAKRQHQGIYWISLWYSNRKKVTRNWSRQKMETASICVLNRTKTKQMKPLRLKLRLDIIVKQVMQFCLFY